MSILERIITENFSKLLKNGKIVRNEKCGIIENIYKAFSFNNKSIHAIQTVYKKYLPNGNIKIRSVGYLQNALALRTIIKNPQGEIVEHFVGTRFANGNSPFTRDLFIEKPFRKTISYSERVKTLIKNYKVLKTTNINPEDNYAVNTTRKYVLDGWKQTGLKV